MILTLGIVLLIVGGVGWVMVERKVDYLSEIGKIIVLPDETPEIAVVTDKTKLVGQPFFAKAEDGDVVLMYLNSGKALLYRPRVKKMVEMTSLTVVVTPTPKREIQPSKIRIALYNGTTKSGLTGAVEKVVVEEIGQLVEVVAKEKSIRSDVSETILVKLNNTDVPKKIIDFFGAKVVDYLPEGEQKPTADLLVILGKEWLK